jgi:hypothetical protein
MAEPLVLILYAYGKSYTIITINAFISIDEKENIYKWTVYSPQIAFIQMMTLKGLALAQSNGGGSIGT